jgi:hypothetical protein
MDSNSEREMDERSKESKPKSVPRQAPLKEHGQPEWRDVKND